MRLMSADDTPDALAPAFAPALPGAYPRAMAPARCGGAGQVGRRRSHLPGGGRSIPEGTLALGATREAECGMHPEVETIPAPSPRRTRRPRGWRHLATDVLLLLYYYSMPGPAVVRWMTGRRSAAAPRPLQGARSC